MIDEVACSIHAVVFAEHAEGQFFDELWASNGNSMNSVNVTASAFVIEDENGITNGLALDVGFCFFWGHGRKQEMSAMF